jgi:hypothetical protein
MRLKPSPWGVGIFRHLNSRGSQVRTRLAAGGRWIRTIGPWREGAGFCCGRRIAGDRTGAAQKGCHFYGVPMVRIHLPPADSQSLSRSVSGSRGRCGTASLVAVLCDCRRHWARCLAIGAGTRASVRAGKQPRPLLLTGTRSPVKTAPVAVTREVVRFL